MDQREDLSSLREALRVVESWGGDWSSLLELDEVDRVESKRWTRPKTRTAKRNRPSMFQTEKARLQADVAELEKIVAAARASTTVNLNCDGLTDELVVALRRECGAILERQSQLRMDAQVENAKLHRLMSSQLKTAHRTVKLLRKVGAIRETLRLHPIQVRKAYDGPIVSLASHFQRLDFLTSRAHKVFASDLFAGNRADELHEINIHETGSGGLQIDFAVSWQLPFPVNRVADALWAQTTHPKRSDMNASFTDLYADRNVLVSRVTSEPRFAIDNCDVLGKITHGEIATRREPTSGDGSITLVSSVQAKIFFANGAARGCFLGEIWLRVEPVNARVSRVLWSRRMAGYPPDHLVSDQRSRWLKKLMAGPVLHHWRRNLKTNVQSVENMLLVPQVHA